MTDKPSIESIQASVDHLYSNSGGRYGSRESFNDLHTALYELKSLRAENEALRARADRAEGVCNKRGGMVIAIAEGRETVPLDGGTPDVYRAVQKLRQVADAERARADALAARVEDGDRAHAMLAGLLHSGALDTFTAGQLLKFAAAHDARVKREALEGAWERVRQEAIENRFNRPLSWVRAAMVQAAILASDTPPHHRRGGRAVSTDKSCPRHGDIGGAYMTIHLPYGDASWCLLCWEEAMVRLGVHRAYPPDECPVIMHPLTLATQRTGGLPAPGGEREVEP
jgi:hypothetical protein